MNLTFGPVFMAAHRISDTYIEMRARGEKPIQEARFCGALIGLVFSVL